MRIEVHSLRETERVAARLAGLLRPGDVILLQGGLGAGKTAFARALLRTLADDPGLDVPSPTFTLAQSYDDGLPVLHVDLYRLSSPEEVLQLGLDDALDAGVRLIEWPERAGAHLPRGATLAIAFAHDDDDPDARVLTFVADEAWRGRLENVDALSS